MLHRTIFEAEVLYTQHISIDLRDAISKAQIILDAPTTQREINTAVSELNAAIAAAKAELAKTLPPPDTAALQSAIDRAMIIREEMHDLLDYLIMTGSPLAWDLWPVWGALNDAIDRAQETLSAILQSEVDNATDRLLDAIEAARGVL